MGNLKVMSKLTPGSVDEKWHTQYGSVLKYDGYLSVRHITRMFPANIFDAYYRSTFRSPPVFL